MAEWLTLSTPDGPMRAYVARPATSPKSALVVLQEAFGVNANIRGIADDMAGLGYLAIAPDLFHRTQTGELPYDRHADAVALISQLGRREVVNDVGSVLRHLESAEGLAAHRTGVLGFCFGGRAAFTAATALPVAAAVVFYGPGIAAGPHAVLDAAGNIRCPVLLHVGADDALIPAAQVSAIAEALDRTGVAYEQYVYAGAGHAFAAEQRPEMYRPVQAALAWSRTRAFLDKALPAHG